MTNVLTMTDALNMANVVTECILSRRATKYYDPAVTVSDKQIRELVRIGTTAPTSFHLQNWRFIAVRTPEAKARLVRSPGISPRSSKQPLPSSSAASWPIPA
jgi:nitroreductase